MIFCAFLAHTWLKLLGQAGGKSLSEVSVIIAFAADVNTLPVLVFGAGAATVEAWLTPCSSETLLKMKTKPQNDPRVGCRRLMCQA